MIFKRWTFLIILIILSSELKAQDPPIIYDISPTGSLSYYYPTGWPYPPIPSCYIYNYGSTTHQMCKMSMELLHGASTYYYEDIWFNDPLNPVNEKVKHWWIVPPLPDRSGLYRITVSCEKYPNFGYWDVYLNVLNSPHPPYNPPFWSMQVTWPNGEIHTKDDDSILYQWDPVIEEAGTPWPLTEKVRMRVYYKADPLYQDQTIEVPYGSYPTGFEGLIFEGEYVIELHIFEGSPTNKYFLMDYETITIIDDAGPGSSKYWDQDEIDRYLAAAEGSKVDLEELKKIVKSYQFSNNPEIKDDTASGDPKDLADAENAIKQKIPELSWEDQEVYDPFILSMPGVNGQNVNMELQFDPRGWDLQNLKLQNLNTWRQIIRVFLTTVLTIFLIAKILRTIRRY